MSRAWWFTSAQEVPGAAYNDEVVADSPAIFYKLNETSGTAVIDYSGNGRDGTYTGTPSFSATPPYPGAGAVLLDGTTERIEPDTWYQPSITDQTFEVWFKVANGYSTSISTFLSQQSNEGQAGGGIAVGIGVAPGAISSAGRIWSGWMQAGISELTWTNVNTYNDGNWHYLAVVYDGTTGVAFDATQITIYIDGAAVADTEQLYADYGGTAPFATAPAWFAGSNEAGWDTYVACTLSNIAFYETALSQARIEAHYAASGL